MTTEVCVDILMLHDASTLAIIQRATKDTQRVTKDTMLWRAMVSQVMMAEMKKSFIA